MGSRVPEYEKKICCSILVNILRNLNILCFMSFILWSPCKVFGTAFITYVICRKTIWSLAKRIHKVTDGNGILIPFEVSPLHLHILNPPFFSQPKTLTWCYTTPPFSVYLIVTFGTGYFQSILQFGKQLEVTRSHI